MIHSSIYAWDLLYSFSSPLPLPYFFHFPLFMPFSPFSLFISFFVYISFICLPHFLPCLRAFLFLSFPSTVINFFGSCSYRMGKADQKETHCPIGLAALASWTLPVIQSFHRIFFSLFLFSLYLTFSFPTFYPLFLLFSFSHIPFCFRLYLLHSFAAFFALSKSSSFPYFPQL